MTTRSRYLPGLVALMGLCVPVRAQEKDDAPDTRAIVKKVDQAAKALKGARYEAEFVAEGYQADQQPRIRGTVMVRKVKPGVLGLMGGPQFRLRAEGKLYPPGSDEARDFLVATDGKMAYAIDHSRKKLITGELAEARQLLREGQALFMQEYTHPTPFTDELEADSRVYEGSREIGGVDCHVIYVKYSRGQGEARWYFGKEDNLPHRVDRLIVREDQKRYNCLVVHKLEIDPAFGKGTFRLNAPEGYKEVEFEPGAPEEDEPGLLAVGTRAPNWELKTPDGATVSLADLKGNVVVMDFWAPWCLPCRIAMKHIQKIHEAYKGKPVKVIGLSCWARKGQDPAEYMKKQNYTYGLLLKADAVAERYNVQGLPTFYVIGPDGKIVYASTYAIGKEKEIEAAVEKALDQADL
jgi:peroxiredoxin